MIGRDTSLSAVRTFISSTFLDLQEERDVMVNIVFPRLRRRFRNTGLEIVDVDLRWGVTEEQASRGETIGLCLAEIERCRPFFIGIVGERYGWVPDPAALSVSLQLAYPVLIDNAGKSITEIEFDFGPLGKPDEGWRAIFLLRRPQGAAAPDPRVAAFRARVSASGFPIIEYDAPEDFVDQLESLLAQAIADQRGSIPALGSVLN